MYLTENWRLKDQRYTLTGARLNDDKVSFPPRPVEARTVETYDFTEEDTAQTPEEIELAKAS